ncbi:MAG: hypothetical protein K0S18_2174 [Anaerocolumna sp.]|nr:hypothetical protein [Anaerocolumna sp.]
MNRLVEEMKKVGVFYVSTIDGDQPRVRPFSSVCDFEGKTYICTKMVFLKFFILKMLPVLNIPLHLRLKLFCNSNHKSTELFSFIKR